MQWISFICHANYVSLIYEMLKTNERLNMHIQEVSLFMHDGIIVSH